MISEHHQGLNDDQIEEKVMEKLKAMSQKYQIKESLVLPFINQNLHLSNIEIIDFIDSCHQIILASTDKFTPSMTERDFVYCLMSGRSKIVKEGSEQNNWELKRHKLVTLHNYKVSKRDETFYIVAENNCRFLRFNLPFSRQQHKILTIKRLFLCSFFNLDFNRSNFQVLDLFEAKEYICGEKISSFKNKLIIVKDGACNYSYKPEGTTDVTNSKITMLDRNGPFVINIQNFVGQDSSISKNYEIVVKQAQIVCFQASIEKILSKSFYYSAVVKKLKQFCQKESRWIHNMIQEKKLETHIAQRTIKRVPVETSEPLTLSLSRFKNVEINKRLFDRQEQQINLLAKTISKSRLVDRQKRSSLQIELGKETLTPVPHEMILTNLLSKNLNQRSESRKSSSAMKQENPEQVKTVRQISNRMNSLKMMSDYHETINKKKKILNSKLKSTSNFKQDQVLFNESLSTETKSFKLRMIHSGIKVVPNYGIKHTDSTKKLDGIKTKYIEKIERSNRIGMQCMVIHSDSADQFLPINYDFLQTRRMSMSTKRLSNIEYHNYLVHGDIKNPKEEPLEKVHQRVKMLSTSYTATYNHSKHLKSKSKLLRYSSTKRRSTKKL